MDVRNEIIDATTPSGPMAILQKRPSGDGDWPTIVLFHDGPGIRRATHEFAEKLAAEGYEVLVPDLYHRHGRLIGYEPEQRAADPSLADRMRELLASVTDDGVQDDLDATLAALAIEPTRPLGTIGFCMGARAVACTLLRRPDQFVAGAMWHPSFLADDGPDSPHLGADELARPLYIGIGDADQVQPIVLHQRFFDAVAPRPDVEIEVFPGADHGFTWPGYPTYDAAAADGAFAKTTALFRAALG